MNKRHKELREKYRSLEQTTNILQEDIKNQILKLNESNFIITNLKNENNNLESNIKQIKDSNRDREAKLVSEIFEKDSTIHQLQHTIQVLKDSQSLTTQQYVNSEEIRMSIQSEIHRLRETECSLRQSVKEYETETEKMTHIMNIQERTIQSLREKISAMQEAHKQDLSKVHEQYEQNMTESQRTAQDMTSLRATLTSVSNYLMTLLNSASSDASSTASIQDTIDCRASIRALSRSLTSTGADGKASESELTILLERVEKVVEEYSKGRYGMTSLRIELQEAQDKIDKCNAEHQSLRAKMDVLLSDLEGADGVTNKICSQLVDAGFTSAVETTGKGSVGSNQDNRSASLLKSASLEKKSALSPATTSIDKAQVRYRLTLFFFLGILECIRIDLRFPPFASSRSSLYVRRRLIFLFLCRKEKQSIRSYYRVSLLLIIVRAMCSMREIITVFSYLMQRCQTLLKLLKRLKILRGEKVNELTKLSPRCVYLSMRFKQI